MIDTLTRLAGAALMLAPALALMWLGSRAEPPAPAPKRPVAAPDAGEWLLLPFQLLGGLAGLCWLLVCLAVFLAPLAFVALFVAGLVVR